MGIMGKKKERSFEKISLLPANEDDGQIDINNGFYEPQYTVNECLEYIGFGWFQVKLTVVLGFSWMADAIAITSLAVLAPALQCDWNLSPEQTALISTCVFIGMFFGAGFWGWFCDTFGRKLALTLSASLILVSFLCSSFAINYNFVLIFMIMEGFSVAGAGQSMTMFFELLPANKRAVGLVMLGIFFVLGNVLSGLVAVFVMNQHGWRWFVRMTSIPIFILILFLWWLPESPRYLIGIGKREAAAKVLSRIADENNSQLPNGKLKILPCYQRKPRGRIIDLLKIDQRRTTTLLWFLWFSAVFCYYGVLLCTTLLLNKREKLCDSHSPFDGMKHLIIRRGGLPMTIIPVNHNASSLTTSNTNGSIGGHCHRMTSSDYLGFLFTALGEIPGLLLCFGLADRLGRRPALSVLCFVSVLAMSLLHACLNRYLLVGTLFILRAFVTGFIQTVYLYTPEVYPTNIRAIGFGTASSMARIGAIITPFVSEVLLDTYPHHAIFIYSGLMAFCIFASLLLPIETKGMKLKEFEEESEPNDNG